MLWGVGPKMRQHMEKLDITDTKTLRSHSLESLQKLFGQAQGIFLYNVCRGRDPGIFQEAKSHSISSERTFATDISDDAILQHYLLQLSHEVMFRSLEDHVMARTVAIKLRTPDFTTISAQVTPDIPIYSAEQVYQIAKQLMEQKRKTGTPVRLLGVVLAQVYEGDAPQQEELFDSAFKKKRALEKTVLDINRITGQHVTKASLLEKPDNP